MQSKRLTGRDAGVLKYDILTGLAVVGLHGSPGLQKSVLRLIAVVTARYNWRTDELTVGQRDMARLWDCNERTVKREIKRLTNAGLLKCVRPGVRGRVSAYRLEKSVIASLSEAIAPAVGPDFKERIAELRPPPATVVKVDFRSSEPDIDKDASEFQDAWRRALRQIHHEEPSLYTNWFSKVSFEEFSAGELHLKAETRFIARYIETRLAERLCSAAESEFGHIDRLTITA